MKHSTIFTAILTATVLTANAQGSVKPEDTELWDPVPEVVTPGKANSAPSDATVLFNGSNLNNWESEKSGPASWTIADGLMTVKPGSGNIRTKQRSDYGLISAASQEQKSLFL